MKKLREPKEKGGIKMNLPPEVIDLIEKNQAVIFSLNGRAYRIEPFDPYDYVGKKEVL